MNKDRFLRRFAICFLPCLAIAAQPPAAANLGFAISRDQACRALALPDDQCIHVDLLGRPLAARQDPILRVGRRMRTSLGEEVTLRCDAASCLPFFVLIRDQWARLSTIAESIPASTGSNLFAVRPGDLASLVQASDGVRLTRRVICLERGRIGDVIRVREAGTRTLLRAMVLRAGEVEAAY
jgi:hypothetical protein